MSSWFIKNRLITSPLLGLSAGVLTHYGLEYGTDLLGTDSWKKLAFFGTTVFSFSLMSFLSYVKKPSVKNSLEGIIGASAIELLRMFPRNQWILDTALKYERALDFPNPNTAKFLEAMSSLSQGVTLEGVLQLTSFFETERRVPRDVFHRRLVQPLILRVANAYAHRSSSLGNFVELALQAWSSGDFETLDRTTRRIGSLDDSLETSIVEGLILSKTKRDRAKIVWQDIVKDESHLVPIVESRNKVFNLGTSNKVPGSVVIKFSDAQDNRLRREYEKLLLVEDHFSISSMPTVVPVEYFIFQGKEVLILYRKKTDTFEVSVEKLDDNSLQEAFEQVYRNLAHFHSLERFYPNGHIYSSRRELSRRLGNRFGFSEKYYLLQIEMIIANTRINSGCFVYSHCDFYGTNVMSDGTIFDLETTKYASPHLDTQNFYAHPNLTERVDLGKAMKVYLEVREGRENKTINMGSPDFYAVFAPMCQVGSFWAKPKGKGVKTARHFVDLTLERIQATGLIHLRDPFLRYLQSSNAKALLL